MPGVAVTASEALAASTAYVDSYCVDPPAEIRTAAIGLFARWIERYPSDGIVSVNHSRPIRELGSGCDGVWRHAVGRRGLS